MARHDSIDADIEKQTKFVIYDLDDSNSFMLKITYVWINAFMSSMLMNNQRILYISTKD